MKANLSPSSSSIAKALLIGLSDHRLLNNILSVLFLVLELLVFPRNISPLHPEV